MLQSSICFKRPRVDWSYLLQRRVWTRQALDLLPCLAAPLCSGPLLRLTATLCFWLDKYDDLEDFNPKKLGIVFLALQERAKDLCAPECASCVVSLAACSPKVSAKMELPRPPVCVLPCTVVWLPSSVGVISARPPHGTFVEAE